MVPMAAWFYWLSHWLSLTSRRRYERQEAYTSMRFSPISFVLSDLIAKNRGVSSSKATTDALVGGFLPPLMGVVLVSALAQKQGSSNTTLPPPVLNAALSQTGDAVLLTWSPSPGAMGYNVYRNGSVRPINSNPPLSSTARGYEDNTVTSDTTYTYTVQAVDSNNNPTTTSASVSVPVP